MNVFRTLTRALRRRSDLAEELESHLRMAVADRVARGESPESARREVLREFGNVPLVADVTREGWGWIWVEDFLQDVRYGFRTLLKQRSFTFVTVLTLALGIGACTAIFSLVNAVLLRSLPYGNPERLVYLFTPNAKFDLPAEVFGPSNADFFDLQRQSHSFAEMTLFTQATYNAAAEDRPQRLSAAKVDAGFFRTLQSSPEFGRVIQEADEQPGKDRVVVISHAIWRSVFGGRSDVLKRTLRLDGTPYEIVGIMPPEFGYPHDNDLKYGSVQGDTQIWIPSALTPQQRVDRENFFGNAVARLKPGVTIDTALAEMKTIVTQLDLLHSAEMRGWTALIEPFRENAFGPVKPLMWLLLGAVGFVLLIACANAANLLLARGANRAHELGVRATLGARRGRLMRQMLTESLMLSTASGLVGVGFAYLFLHALLRLDPGDIPRMREATLDLRMLGFVVAITVLTSVLFGVLPSLTMTRVNLVEFLKSSGLRGVVGDRRRVRGVLAISQIALVVVLLTGAGLFLRSYAKVLSVPTGFSPSTVTANVQLNQQYNTLQKKATFFREMMDRIRSLQGVEAVGIVDHVPLSHSESMTFFEVEGYSNEKNQLVESRAITQDYLSAMQVPVLRGRGFTDDDGRNSVSVALVNEAFAKKYFAGRSPIGRRIRFPMSPTDPPTTVVGVTGDVRNESLEAAVPAQIYIPFWRPDKGGEYSTDSSNAHIVVRSVLPESVLVAEMRGVLKGLDPNLAIANAHKMSELVWQARARRRFQTTLLTVFSGIAMFLAVVGIYGLLAYSVRQRTGEIGIRMALGSSKGGVVGLVLREGLGMLVVGLVIGLAGAFAGARLLNGFLYGVPAIDPVTFALVPVLLLIATLAACLVPSFRAAAVDPMQALRHE